MAEIIKPGEIRIGNYFYAKHKYIENSVDRMLPVTAIHSEKGVKRGNNVSYVEYKDLIPVKLNAHIFRRFHFDILGNKRIARFQFDTHAVNFYEHNHDGLWYPTYIQIPEMSCEDMSAVSLKCVKHLHELQNLIYRLQEIELDDLKEFKK